jgi:hypothetical protein
LKKLCGKHDFFAEMIFQKSLEQNKIQKILKIGKKNKKDLETKISTEN